MRITSYNSLNWCDECLCCFFVCLIIFTWPNILAPKIGQKSGQKSGGELWVWSRFESFWVRWTVWVCSSLGLCCACDDGGSSWPLPPPQVLIQGGGGQQGQPHSGGGVCLHHWGVACAGARPWGPTQGPQGERAHCSFHLQRCFWVPWPVNDWVASAWVTYILVPLTQVESSRAPLGGPSQPVPPPARDSCSSAGWQGPSALHNQGGGYGGTEATGESRKARNWEFQQTWVPHILLMFTFLVLIILFTFYVFIKYVMLLHLIFTVILFLTTIY